MNKLYIGNLPQDTNEESLRELFHEQSGVNPQSILVKKGGYAFVECFDEEAAAKAVEVLNGFKFMDSELLVEPSIPQDQKNRTTQVQVSNIPSHVQWDDITKLLETFGEVQQCDRGPADSENSFTVVVRYDTSDQAYRAFTELNGLEFESSHLKVDFVMEQSRGGRTNRGTFRPYPYSGTSPNPLHPTDFPLRILVFSDMVGAIIGRAGGAIRQITQQSRARVDIHRKENAGSLEKVITIYGNPENCSLACQKILEVMQKEAESTSRGDIPLKILAHNNLIGRIIGKNGNTIKGIMEKTDTKITVSSSVHDVTSFNMERTITIVGNLENISKAEQMISAKLRQSYENDLSAMAPQTFMFPGVHPMAMMSTMGGPGYPLTPRGGPATPPYGMYNTPPPYVPKNYSSGPPPSQQLDPVKEQVFLYIPNSAVGAIIGTGGSNIREMINSSGASIKVAQPNTDEPLEKQTERKVTILGTPESQWKAQFMIFKKVSCEGFVGPQEAHLRVEVFVPTSQVGRIIGKGGQTVREIQRITQAVIKLPEESQNSQAEETAVHIIGDFYSSQAAQCHIRALVARSQPGYRGLITTPPQPPHTNQTN